MTLSIKLISNTARKGGIISSINGGQFWLDGVLFSGSVAGFQAAIINIENGRE